MPHTKTVSVGIFVKSGSMYETEKEKGISHFIEHMLFKGTCNRSAKDIAEEMDFAGGHINAYTARECTCYYTKVLSEDLRLSAEILGDMYYNSLFREEDIELERGVIIEEINMYEDSPEDLALDTVCEYMWKDNPLGYIISGSEESVKGISREMMLDYMSRRYTPENTVISVAGAFDEEDMKSIFEEFFSQGKNAPSIILGKPDFTFGTWSRVKDVEQAHLSIAYRGLDLSSDKLYTMSVLNNILGGSMSSRLFQKVREENGLCYSIYSYTASFPQAGMMGIYAGLADNSLEKALDMIDGEIGRICSEKVSEYELKKALSQIKCGIVMSRESAASHMAENGKSLLLTGRVRTDDEILKAVLSVTEEDILNVANEILGVKERTIFILNNK
ncbi:MAG: insulinase family protein [Clostridia bacterium]|nr:insulinase family protein [Clostridia bacterium]